MSEIQLPKGVVHAKPHINAFEFKGKKIYLRKENPEHLLRRIAADPNCHVLELEGYDSKKPAAVVQDANEETSSSASAKKPGKGT